MHNCTNRVSVCIGLLSNQSKCFPENTCGWIWSKIFSYSCSFETASSSFSTLGGLDFHIVGSFRGKINHYVDGIVTKKTITYLMEVRNLSPCRECTVILLYREAVWEILRIPHPQMQRSVQQPQCQNYIADSGGLGAELFFYGAGAS